MSIDLKSDGWSEDRTYRTGTEYEPVHFYLNALLNSNRFDLLLGYFSSAAISILSLGFARFLSNDGKVRMIINNVLSLDDQIAIKKGQTNDVVNNTFNIKDIKAMKRTLDEYGIHFFECLAWLISKKHIEIIIVKPKNTKGISHYKSGVFYDNINSVGFKASCNFTACGLLGNLEEVDSYYSWESEISEARIEGQKNYFNNIFNKKAHFVEYVKIDDIEIIIKNEFGNKDLEELLIQENELFKKKQDLLKNEKFNSIVSDIIEKYEADFKKPRFPFAEGPRDYQKKAYLNWVSNNYHGIFAMATGTGKTITALNCVLEEYLKHNEYKIIILVPTLILINQWDKEAKSFNFRNIIKASSNNGTWKDELYELTLKEQFNINLSYVIISTYETFKSKNFQNFIKNANEKVILIADEAHNLGAPGVLKLLNNIKITKRIGLSATPRRVYDPEGSIVMEGFFNDKEPYIVNLPMEDAINTGILCPYYYNPIIVELTEDETLKYAEISIKLARFFGSKDKDQIAKKNYEMLLIQRKNIIHKAVNKMSAFQTLIKIISETNTGLKYLLVYAPEGYYGDDISLDSEFPDIADESRIIDYYSNIIRKLSPQSTMTQYISNTENKETILKDFEECKIDILLSMKCLDEGVDIPRTEQAIFCSSTGNPRQFIQRRGRILRTHRDKSTATIYDMVVIPKVDVHSESYSFEQNMVKKELERVVHFGYMALNKPDLEDTLKDVCDYYKLHLDTLYRELRSK